MKPVPLMISIGMLFLIAVCLPSCSISYSVGKSSDSIEAMSNSISDSSSDSSGSSEKDAKNAYRDDVGNLTAMAVLDNYSSDAYMAEIGKIAENYGVTNWEKEMVTYIGIGQGLKSAGVKDTQLDQVDCIRPIVNADQSRWQHILQGYFQTGT